MLNVLVVFGFVTCERAKETCFRLLTRVNVELPVPLAKFSLPFWRYCLLLSILLRNPNKTIEELVCLARRDSSIAAVSSALWPCRIPSASVLVDLRTACSGYRNFATV